MISRLRVFKINSTGAPFTDVIELKGTPVSETVLDLNKTCPGSLPRELRYLFGSLSPANGYVRMIHFANAGDLMRRPAFSHLVP